MCLWDAWVLRAELQAVDYGGTVIPEKVLDPSEPRAPILKSGGGGHKESKNYKVAVKVATKKIPENGYRAMGNVFTINIFKYEGSQCEEVTRA